MSTKDKSLALVTRMYATRGGDLLQYVRHRLRNDADAADIAHEAFLRFLRLEDPERLTNPDAYIFRIAANLLWEKQLRRQEELGQPVEDDLLQDEHTPLDYTVADETASRLREALDRLPVMARAVLVLHLRDGLSFADIATHTGVSNTMAKKHLRNAITLCRKYLRDFAIEPGWHR